MKLEVGKRYVMANGEVTGKLWNNETESFYSVPVIEGYLPVWKSDGKALFFINPEDSDNEPFNIVAEYNE